MDKPPKQSRKKRRDFLEQIENVNYDGICTRSRRKNNSDKDSDNMASTSSDTSSPKSIKTITKRRKKSVSNDADSLEPDLSTIESESHGQASNNDAIMCSTSSPRYHLGQRTPVQSDTNKSVPNNTENLESHVHIIENESHCQASNHDACNASSPRYQQGQRTPVRNDDEKSRSNNTGNSEPDLSAIENDLLGQVSNDGAIMCNKRSPRYQQDQRTRTQSGTKNSITDSPHSTTSSTGRKGNKNQQKPPQKSQESPASSPCSNVSLKSTKSIKKETPPQSELTCIQIAADIPATSDVKCKKPIPKKYKRKKVQPNVIDINSCNLSPTVRIDLLPMDTYRTKYKVSEVLRPHANTDEKLGNSKIIGQQFVEAAQITVQQSKPSDLIKSKPNLRKRKSLELSNSLNKKIKIKKVNKRVGLLKTRIQQHSNNVVTNFTVSNDSKLSNLPDTPQVNNSVDNSEYSSKILRHTHTYVNPPNIQININRNQERIVEFTNTVTTSPIRGNERTNSLSPQHLSDSSSFTNTPMPYVDYYSGFNDWVQWDTEENLYRITSDNFLFSNATVSLSADFEVKNFNPNFTTQTATMSSNNSLASDFDFVKPCKRPPNRIRSSKSSTGGGSVNSMSAPVSDSVHTDTSQMDDKDDVLSIYSSMSIKSRDFPKTPSSRTNERIEAHIPLPTPRNIIADDSEHNSNLLPISDTSYKSVEQWVENAQIYQTPHNKAFMFSKICFSFLRNQYCPRRICKFSHEIPCFQNLNLMQLHEALEYVKDKWNVLLPYATIFIQEFGRRNCPLDLLSFVSLIMIPENKTKLKHIKEIISSLQANGYTFEGAVEKIMMIHKNNFELLNILLVIMFNNEVTLCDNWHLVQKLFECRNFVPIDPSLVNNIMTYCYRVYNIQLSVKIVRDIFKRNLVDPQHISRNHFNRISSILQKHEPEEADALLHIAKINNIITDFPSDTHSDQFCIPFAPDYNPARPKDLDANSNFNRINFNNTGQTVIPPNINEPTNQDGIHRRVYTNNGNQPHASDNETNNHCDEELDYEELHHEPLGAIITNEQSNSGETLSDSEIKRLDFVISSEDHKTLFAMYNHYKNAANSNVFVINALALLKKKNAECICNLVERLIENLEFQNQNLDVPYLPNAEATLYLLILNTVGLLKQLKGFKEAATLLHKFMDCLENLTQVHWYPSIHLHSYTIIGKYLYFCDVFTRGKFYDSTLQLFKCPELKLLHSSSKWKLPHATFDEDFRNRVLHDFILVTLKENLDVAKDLILYLMKKKREDIATEIDTSKYFDKLVLAMLNSNTVNHLTEILPHILEGWYTYLKFANMRALLIILVANKISQQHLITLYSKCCQQGIYPKLKGNESRICLRTDMSSEEIFITIRYFFYKLLKNNFQTQEILFTIKMPDELNNRPKILLDSQCGLIEMKKRTLLVLTHCFPHIIIAQSCGDDIKVKADQLKLCLESYKKSSSRCFWARQSSVDRLGPM